MIRSFLYEQIALRWSLRQYACQPAVNGAEREELTRRLDRGWQRTREYGSDHHPVRAVWLCKLSKDHCDEDGYGSQILIVWSTLPDATTLTILSRSAPLSAPAPLGLASPSEPLDVVCRPQARHVTKCPCACTVFTQRPVLSSHTLIV